MELQRRKEGGWKTNGEGGQRGDCRFSEVGRWKCRGRIGKRVGSSSGGVVHLVMLGMDGENDEKGGVCGCGCVCGGVISPPSRGY